MPFPQSPFKNRLFALTSASSAQSFSPPIAWIWLVAAGVVVMKDETGTAFTSPTLPANSVLLGPFTTFTSTTCSNVILGDGPPPTGLAAASVLNLAGGAGSVTGILPSGNLPDRQVAGAALTDAPATITIAQGTWRTMPAATLSATRAITLSATGAVAGDIITITRLDATANTMTVVNGGAGAGTLHTFPASKIGFIDAQFDGTNWAVKRVTPL